MGSQFYVLFLYVLFSDFCCNLRLRLITRPIGAYLWRHVGDRAGRRNAMVWPLVVVGIGILAMGLTPGYDVIAAAGLILLSIFRLVQGLSFGGEFGSASAWLVEGAAGTKRRAFWGSWVGQSLPLGIIVGLGSVAVITALLPQSAVISYGWRVLFIIGFLAAVSGVLIRLRLSESPLFKELEEKRQILDQH